MTQVMEPGPLASAQALLPLVREASPRIEQERQLPTELVAAFRDAGLFHLVVPKSAGGSETDPVTAARVVEEIATADASAAWCLMLAAQSGTFAGFLAANYAREIWGDGGIVAGVARPIGRAVATETPERGFVVSGRWPFASGSSHATWFAAECVLYDGDAPRKTATGDEVTRMLFVPRSAVTVYDTWDTTGLRGTASNDFSVDGCFVPEGRGFQVLVTPPVHRWALYTVEPLAFINHGSHALGVARGAIETAREIAINKPGWGNQAKLRDVPRIQAAFAEATALVEAGRRFLYGTATGLWESAMRGDPGSAELRARVRLATSHAATSSVRAVDLLHAAMGTSAIFTKSPLERQFRDIHTAAAHVMISPLTFEAAGRVELGLTPDFPFF